VQHSEYLSTLEKDLLTLYALAGQARSEGLDPSLEPEPYVARDLAEMVEGLVGPKGVAARIRELVSAKMDKYEMAFAVASDIVHARFGHTDPEAGAEQAVRSALAIMTGGITAAPMQGIAHVRIRENPDKTSYLAVYFAGPIRSAGGTEQAVTLVVADHVRKILGLDSYKPTDVEIRRFLEELRLYEREVSRFQYHLPDELLVSALERLPVECTGTETDPVEVSSYRNIPRIETNRVRAGGLRVVNDGIVGRAQKVLRIVEAKNIPGWDWLGKLKQQETPHDAGQKKGTGDDAAYMEDIIAGRPVFGFPSRRGGFRLRYGRSRNTGLAALGVHPAAMGILGGFLASGTQMRIEGPGKGCVVLPVDTIEAPVVKLKDGSVRRVEDYDEAVSIRGSVSSILFLGDLLVAFSEFLENNKPLSPSGYTEEWWAEELKAKIGSLTDDAGEKQEPRNNSEAGRLLNMVRDPLHVRPTACEALRISRSLKIPLHPRYTYFWSSITVEELQRLRGDLLEARTNIDESGGRLELHQSHDEAKTTLEKLCVPHIVEEGRVILEAEELDILSALLRLDEPNVQMPQAGSAIEVLSSYSSIPLREKAMTFIGARMGRPEKAKRREMSPPVHGLFPVGLVGGSQRNIVLAASKGIVRAEVARRRCPTCDQITYMTICRNCGSRTVQEFICSRCHRSVPGDNCPACKARAFTYESKDLPIGDLFDKALETLGNPRVELVKGVRGLMSGSRTPEILEKAVLRAKHGLSVFKDGTIRYDATNAPLTHFKAKEVSTSIERLRELGYLRDSGGEPLQDESQTCELKVQDVILPEDSASYLLNECRFVDELLEKVYKLPAYYKAESKERLIGQLILGFAPHTSAAVLGRVIGFSKTSVCYAHPLWHNIKRRDCDGDEDSVMMVLDVLLNFSKAYLPSQIGGLMDAPLLIISAVDPYEVDEAQNLDVSSSIPLEFYAETLQRSDPKAVSAMFDILERRLGKPEQFEGYHFTHETYDINEGNLRSCYSSLGTMSEKMKSQLELAEKLRAVEAREVARRVLTTHLLRDIAGNLKAFTGQRLRCKRCNAKYRRIPLTGKCNRCGGELTMTVHRKGIEKYLDVAVELVKKYDLDPYYAQRLDLIRGEIEHLFSKAETTQPGERRQIKLAEFM
jgi:DNA polymerase II large subunit